MVKSPGVPSVRLTVRSSLYVVAVALITAVGFTEQSAWPILFAALLAVPASIVAVPCYYLAYGFPSLRSSTSYFCGHWLLGDEAPNR